MELFRRTDGDETILMRDETIFRLPRRTLETAVGYQADNDTAELPAVLPGDGQMRTLGFMIACAFVLAGSTAADSTQGALPGVGSFTYNGSPVAAPLAMVVAARSGATD